MVATIRIDEPSMRSAQCGEQMANAVLSHLAGGVDVRVDFAAVETMTPSFANTFLMLLLETYPIETLRARCDFANRSPHVVRVMNRAVLRFQAGIRLSTHRVAVA